MHNLICAANFTILAETHGNQTLERLKRSQTTIHRVRPTYRQNANAEPSIRDALSSLLVTAGGPICGGRKRGENERENHIETTRNATRTAKPQNWTRSQLRRPGWTICHEG
jgi:hypothetical protein